MLCLFMVFQVTGLMMRGTDCGLLEYHLYSFIAHQVISPLSQLYYARDSVHARLGVVGVLLIRNCCNRFWLSWRESFIFVQSLESLESALVPQVIFSLVFLHLDVNSVRLGIKRVESQSRIVFFVLTCLQEEKDIAYLFIAAAKVFCSLNLILIAMHTIILLYLHV